MERSTTEKLWRALAIMLIVFISVMVGLGIYLTWHTAVGQDGKLILKNYVTPDGQECIVGLINERPIGMSCKWLIGRVS